MYSNRIHFEVESASVFMLFHSFCGFPVKHIGSGGGRLGGGSVTVT